MSLAYLVSCVNGTRYELSGVEAYMHKIDLLEVVDKFCMKHPDACSWTVCCSTNFELLGLSKYKA